MREEIDFPATRGLVEGDAAASPSAAAVSRPSSMFERRRFRCLVLIVLGVFVCGLVYLGYFCSDSVCALTGGSPTPPHISQFHAYLEGHVLHQTFVNSELHRDYEDFDVEGESDVIVFLHIQKTGGTTFGKHLVKNIELETPCICYKGRKRCDCENRKQHIWLFSRYSTGWQCGLHADWTELQNCVNQFLNKKEGPTHRR